MLLLLLNTTIDSFSMILDEIGWWSFEWRKKLAYKRKSWMPQGPCYLSGTKTPNSYHYVLLEILNGKLQRKKSFEADCQLPSYVSFHIEINIFFWIQYFYLWINKKGPLGKEGNEKKPQWQNNEMLKKLLKQRNVQLKKCEITNERWTRTTTWRKNASFTAQSNCIVISHVFKLPINYAVIIY